MIKIKRFISFIVIVIVIVMICFNFDKIKNKIYTFTNKKEEIIIKPANEYSKKKDYLYVKYTNDFKPNSYNDLLNIFYTTLDSGWDEFTFYCPAEYSECLNDVNKISNDDILLSNINNYVHPFNSYSNIKTVYDTTGQVTIKINHIYNDNEITQLNNTIDQLMTKLINNTMDENTKIRTIHDFIINNTKYDSNKTFKDSPKATGVLYDNYGICSGYTDTMALFLYKLGIDNFKISSENHIWNAVYINNQWLHLDLTWDDPVSPSDIDTLSHDFYLVNTNELHQKDTKSTEHNFDNQYYLYFN